MGIQISGLLSGSAFDWKSVVDQLIAADSIPVTNLQNEKQKNTDKISALGEVKTSLSDLQDALQSIRSNNVFTARSVSSDLANTTWKSSSSAGAPVGDYTFAVSQLATAASITGKTDIGGGLSTTSDVSGVTLANLNIAAPITAGTFTIQGQQVTIATTDSLKAVFDKISTATGGTVTGAYDPTADKVTLTSSNGELIMGAANDTSNFLQAMKLTNSGGTASTSSAALGVLKTSATLANAGLRTPITAVDGSGKGSFTINNVTFNYNVNTDSLSSILANITSSAAGVNATYDAATDKVVLTNKNTGDVGIALSESSGGLLGSLGLTGSNGTFAHGNNAQFTINGGPTITSASNTLDSSITGISGLSVTVNSKTTQTLSIASDTSSMQTSIQSFLDKFNALQDMIDTKTKVTISAGNVSTSVLSDNREIQSWATELQDMAFNPVTGISGSVTHLDDLGIDFDGTSGHLIIKDQTKLTNALENKPQDVQSFFVSGENGMVPQMYGKLTDLIAGDSTQQDNINQANNDLDDQITTLQSRLDDERTTLTNAFVSMLDAQSNAQSQNQTLTNAFFNNSSGTCWVARAVYGVHNARWLLFRAWLLGRAPAWFRALYLRHGEAFGRWIENKPWLKAVIRRWMDARIASLAT